MYDVKVLGDEILETLARIDRLSARVAAAVAEFDARGEWELDGATSAVAWLRDRARMPASAAKALVRTAGRLRSLPVTQAAWVDGSLSGGQVQAVVANLSDRTASLFAEHEGAVVPSLIELSVTDTAAAMRAWRAHAEAIVDGDEGDLPRRTVHLSRSLDGRFVLDGQLDVEGGELLAAALRLVEVEDFDRPAAQRRGDALVDMARFVLDHHETRPQRRNRPHLNVVVDYAALVSGGPGQVVGGGFLDSASVGRLLCDAGINRVVTDGRSTILDYGTTTRTVPNGLWAALALRDEHCRHAGCDRLAQWCEAHHVVPVLAGGPTSLENLVLKCSRHHHMGHLPGWHEKLLPGAVLVTTDAQGRTRTTHPPGLRRSLPLVS